MRASSVCMLLLLVASPVSGQSTFVTASVTGDVARFSHLDVDVPVITSVLGESALDGEALGFSLAIGRALGERWGVAFEFGRTGEIENRSARRFDARTMSAPPTIARPIQSPQLIVPEFSFESRTELQQTTLSAVIWARHGAGERIDLTYTGGLAFVRSEVESEIDVTDPRLAIWAPLALPEIERIEMRGAPVVGVDAAITVTGQVAVSAGMRAYVVNVSDVTGWLFRPGVGLRWSF